MAKLVPKIYPNDINQNTPIGVSYPFTVGSVKQNYVTTNQIHDNLRNLCLTMKGERPMQPDFGCDLYHLLFEPINDELLSQASRKAIKNAVQL
jgi:phage baseplate assembly protein W